MAMRFSRAAAAGVGGGVRFTTAAESGTITKLITTKITGP